MHRHEKVTRYARFACGAGHVSCGSGGPRSEWGGEGGAEIGQDRYFIVQRAL